MKDKLESLPPSRFSETIMRVMEKLFFSVNEKRGEMKKAGKKGEAASSYYCLSSSLFGLSKLWEIALDADNEKV